MHGQKSQCTFIMNRNLKVQTAWKEISVYKDYRQKYQRQNIMEKKHGQKSQCTFIMKRNLKVQTA